MNNPESIFDNPLFSQTNVNKVNVFTGRDLTIDTYYFSPGQTLENNTRSDSDQCFYFFKGSGKFYLDNGSESVIDVIDGSVVYIPAGISYKIRNNNSEMVAVKSIASKI